MAGTTTSPAERRRQKVRSSIIEAAEKVFAEEGEAGLSIRRLAEAIDYSPAAIYKYFESKDDLINELKESFFSEIVSAAGQHQSKDDFHAYARRTLKTYIQIALQKSYHYAAAFSGQSASYASGIENFVTSKKGQAFNILLELVDLGQRRAVVRTDIDRADAARSIWASCHGLASLLIHLPDFPVLQSVDSELDREDFIDLHVDLIMRGIEIQPPKKQRLPRSRKRTK